MKHLDLTHIIRKQHLPVLITLSLCFIAVSILYITNPSTDLVYHIGEDRIETLDDMYTLNHRQISITQELIIRQIILLKQEFTTNWTTAGATSLCWTRTGFPRISNILAG